MADKAKLFKEAQKHISKGQIDKAIQLWEDYVLHHPDGNIYNTIGDLYYRSGKKEKAIEFFHKAADFFHAEGFLTKAQALYKKILNYNPHDPRALHNIGQMNEEKGLVTDAIKYYLAAADAYAKARDRDSLKEISRKIVELSPGNLSLRVKLAQYLQKEGFIEDAASEYLDIGRVCEESGDIDQAREFYELSLELFPRLRDIYDILFEFYVSQEEYEKARELLEKGKELYSDLIDLDLNLAELERAEGALESAKEKLLRILSEVSLVDQKNLYIRASRLLADIYIDEGKHDLAWESYGVVLDSIMEKGAFDEAVGILGRFRESLPEETAEKLIEIYRKTGDNELLASELILLGDRKLQDGDKEKALRFYTEAEKASPDHPEVREKIKSLEEELGYEEEEVEEEKPEKTLDEKLGDADIFVRYGLLDEALDVLEKLKVDEPENLEVHRRLKNIYLERNDKESAVTECLIMARLFEREGRIEHKEQVLKEAFDIYPEDPRLLELAKSEGGISSQKELEPEFQGSALEGFEMMEEPQAAEEPPQGGLPEYSEELAEADFYIRQGLYEDAMAIYRRLLRTFPGNEEIKKRMEEIGGSAEETAASLSESSEMTPPAEEAASAPEEEEVYEGVTEEIPLQEELEEPPVEETPEPSLDTEVLEIFEEFKKGISEELEEEDYETHYNLGIAYKEMGLLDDAIKEFQMARNDPERKIHVLTMLGICYMEKKLYSLAIEVFSDALKGMTERDESYWGLRYDLAEAYEKHGDIKSALNHYIEVYGWNSSFRNVNERVNQLKQNTGDAKDNVEVAEEEDNRKPRKDRISYI